MTRGETAGRKAGKRRGRVSYYPQERGVPSDSTPQPTKPTNTKWIPEIPTHWKTSRIKYLANDEPHSFDDGDWIESPFITDSGIRYYTTGNIGDGEFKEQGNGFISLETFKKLNCKYAYPGDLVISRLNEPYGRSCIIPNQYDKCILAVDIVILRTNEHKKYLCYVTQCPDFQRAVENQAAGTTMKRISRSKLGAITVPLPPLVEQEAIVSYLDEMTGRINDMENNLSTQRDELIAYRQSVISEYVTGKKRVS